jgi:hypothetical protein
MGRNQAYKPTHPPPHHPTQTHLVSLTLAPGSAHARPSAQSPINNKIPAHVSAESPSNISPNPYKSYPKSLNPRTTFENTPLVPPNI